MPLRDPTIRGPNQPGRVRKTCRTNPSARPMMNRTNDFPCTRPNPSAVRRRPIEWPACTYEPNGPRSPDRGTNPRSRNRETNPSAPRTANRTNDFRRARLNPSAPTDPAHAIARYSAQTNYAGARANPSAGTIGKSAKETQAPPRSGRSRHPWEHRLVRQRVPQRASSTCSHQRNSDSRSTRPWAARPAIVVVDREPSSS